MCGEKGVGSNGRDYERGEPGIFLGALLQSQGFYGFCRDVKNGMREKRCNGKWYCFVAMEPHM